MATGVSEDGTQVAVGRLEEELRETGCAECGSADLSFSDHEYSDDKVEILIRCGGCKAQIFKTFDLTPYQVTEAAEEVADVTPEEADEPVADGAPFEFRGFRAAPESLDEVMVLFGAVMDDLGYLYAGKAPGHSSAYVLVDQGDGLQKKVLKFEHQSHNARRSKGDIGRVGILVCWDHSWDDCPDHIEVVELSKIVREL